MKIKKLYFKIAPLILCAFLVTLPLQLGKHFFLPFSYVSGVRIDYLAPTLYLSDLLAVLLIPLALKNRPKLSQLLMIGIGLICLNTALAHNPLIAIYRWTKLLEIVVVFFAIKNFVLTTKQVLTSLLAGGAIEILLSFLQLAMKHSVQGLFYFLGERAISLSQPDIAKATVNGVEFLRPYGTFSHPNSMAGFYLLIYVLILTNSQKTSYTFLRTLLLLISSVLVFISFSKIAITIYVIISVAYLIHSKFYTHCKFCFIMRIIILSILGGVFFFIQGDPLSAEKRLTLMKNAAEIISRYPLQGVGLGNYLYEQSTFAMKYSYFFLQPVHNVIMLLMSELGIVLFGFFAAQLFFLSRASWRIQTFAYCVGVILATGMVDHYWATLQQNTLLIPVVFGLIASTRKSFT